MISIKFTIILALIVLVEVVRSYDDYDDKLRDGDTNPHEIQVDDDLLARAALLDEYDELRDKLPNGDEYDVYDVLLGSLATGTRKKRGYPAGTNCAPKICFAQCSYIQLGACTESGCIYRCPELFTTHPPRKPRPPHCPTLTCSTYCRYTHPGDRCPYCGKCERSPPGPPPSPPKRNCPILTCPHPCRFIRNDGCHYCGKCPNKG